MYQSYGYHQVNDHVPHLQLADLLLGPMRVLEQVVEAAEEEEDPRNSGFDS
jgi:hypothetical protein